MCYIYIYIYTYNISITSDIKSNCVLRHRGGARIPHLGHEAIHIMLFMFLF